MNHEPCFEMLTNEKINLLLFRSETISKSINVTQKKYKQWILIPDARTFFV